MKTFVLDTNVLLHNSDALNSFGNNIVVLSMAVIEELDTFKRSNDELGRNARTVIRYIDSLRVHAKLGTGVPLTSGGTLKILPDVRDAHVFSHKRDMPDNRMITLAHSLMAAGENVIFVSKDINARVKADSLGLQAEDFEKEKINLDDLYTGHSEITVPSSQIKEFSKNEFYEIPGVGRYPNEFVLMRDEADPRHTALCRVIQPGTVRHLSKNYELLWNIQARNREQRLAIELLMDPQVQLVTLVGQAGTGKTLLAIAAALQCTIRNHQYDRLLVSRPVIPMGKDIGYLPGAKEEKLSAWMQPIYDNLVYLMREAPVSGKKKNKMSPHDRMDKLFREKTIEIEALTYIRGRSIPGQYVIVDEAQNLTPHEVKTIISRAGEGTKMVLTGDPYQIDNPYLDVSSNGLTYTAERMKGESIHGHVTLKKSERSHLAALAAELM
jgi:PhoH-like ATPase